MPTLRALCLLLAPAGLLAGCSQAPTPDQADLQARLTAAEARATAAEKRARNAEDLAAQHRQEPVVPDGPPAAPPEVAEGGGDFGQPVNDTAPIDPAPVMPPQPQQ
jgi:hypothetical protein